MGHLSYCHQIETVRHLIKIKSAMKTFTLSSLVILCCLGAFAQKAFINGVPVSVVDAGTIELTDSLDRNLYMTSIAVTSDAKKLYTSSFFKTYIVDIATHAIEDSIEGISPHLRAGTNANEMYGIRNASFYTINTTDKSVDSIALPNTDRMEFRPDANEMWVTSDSVIHIVDLESGASLSSTIVSGSNQYDGSDLRFSEDGTLAIKMNWNSKTVAKIDAVNKSVTTMMDFGFAASLSGVEVTEDGSSAFISCATNNRVCKINVSSMTVTDSITLDRPGFGMYRHPSNGKIWVVGHFDDIIYIMNPDDMSIEDSLEVGASPHIVRFVKSPLGVKESIETQSLLVFPNPAQDHVTVQLLQGTEDSTLTDMQGRMVNSGSETTAEFQLDLSDLDAGMYLISSGDQVQRIVVR